MATSTNLAGKAWAEAADVIDRQLSPLGLVAMEVLSPLSGDSVLDVGCGSGQSLLQLADRVGPTGRVTGVDISAPLLELARRRIAGRDQIDLVASDAATLALPAQSFDCIFSRFGVMAFPEPIGAFANLRRLLKPSGRMAFVCWRSLLENELDRLPIQAAGLDALLDDTPFSFADPDHIRTVLLAAGFRAVTVQRHDAMVSCGDLDATMAVLLSVGALGKIIRENPQLKPDSDARVRHALAGQSRAPSVVLHAATWVVSAH